MIDSQGCHISGESLVQPQVGPPFHRDQISEPLMGQFVGDHAGDPMPALRGRTVLVVEKGRFPVCDESPVFHGSCAEIRNRDHVLFREWVGQIVKLFVEGQGSGPNAICEIHLKKLYNNMYHIETFLKLRIKI